MNEQQRKRALGVRIFFLGLFITAIGIVLVQIGSV